MADLSSLLGRIDSEFAGFQQRTEQLQAAAKSEYETRERRFREQFVPAAEQVAGLLKPRLQLLIDRFKDRVDVKPSVTEHLRSVEMLFDSPVARIELKFRLSHDAEVKNLLLEQSLDVLPILMKFEDHSTLSMPLGKIDEAAIAAWCDDCIVGFLKTYAEIHHNQYYLKGHLVTDPVAGVEMPTYAAAETLEVDGKKYYFISAETKKEFEARRSSQSKGRS